MFKYGDHKKEKAIVLKAPYKFEFSGTYITDVKITIHWKKYLKKDACAAGNAPSKFLTSPITATKQRPEPSINNIPKDRCFLDHSISTYSFSKNE